MTDEARKNCRDTFGIRAVCGFLALLILAGCVTVKDPEPNGPVSQVTVYRVPSSRDSLFSMLVAIDGRPVTQLYPEEKYSFELQAGDHRLEYEMGLYSCSTAVRLEPGKSYLYRLAQECVVAPGEL